MCMTSMNSAINRGYRQLGDLRNGVLTLYKKVDNGNVLLVQYDESNPKTPKSCVELSREQVKLLGVTLV